MTGTLRSDAPLNADSVSEELVSDVILFEFLTALKVGRLKVEAVRSALSVIAPRLKAVGLREAADRVAHGFPDYDQRGMTAFQMGRMAATLYAMAAALSPPEPKP